MPSIHDFATWEPVLGLLRAANAESLAAPGGHVAGRIDRRRGRSLPLPVPYKLGRSLLVSDMQDEHDAVQRVQDALADGGIDSISLVAEISASGQAVLHLLSLGPAAEPGIAAYPGSLILVQGSVPEPWRRLPDPVPGAAAARRRIRRCWSGRLARLDRLRPRRQRRVRGRSDTGPVRAHRAGHHAPPRGQNRRRTARRLPHGLVTRTGRKRRRAPREPGPPVVARVNIYSLKSVEAAAHPGLEVLCIGVWEGEPLSLVPVTGLPRLRTLTAYPGTLANPLEIAQLTRLEFLQLGPEEWRVLLDAGAVPRSLLAAAIKVHGNRHPLPIVAIANEILSLWGRPQGSGAFRSYPVLCDM